jgi:hypothetical protein
VAAQCVKRRCQYGARIRIKKGRRRKTNMKRNSILATTVAALSLAASFTVIAGTAPTGAPTAPPTTAPRLPDMTSKKGITVGSKFTPWGGSVVLNASEAIAKGGGQCAFNSAYDLVNASGVPAAPAFVDKLRNDQNEVAIQSNITMAANETKQMMSGIYLKPGSHTLWLSIDDGKVVTETNENNNVFRIAYTLDSTCK